MAVTSTLNYITNNAGAALETGFTAGDPGGPGMLYVPATTSSSSRVFATFGTGDGATRRPVLQQLDNLVGTTIEIVPGGVEMIGDPQLIQLLGGSIVVVYATGGGSADIYRVVVNPLTGAIVSGAQAATLFETAGTLPSVAALDNDKWVVAFRGADGSVYAKINSGTAFGGAAEIGVSAGNDAVGGPSVARLADGGFVVTWTELDGVNADLDVFAAVYDASGTQVAGRFDVTDGAGNVATSVNQSSPVVVGLPDGGFVIATTDFPDGRIYVERFDASGASLSKNSVWPANLIGELDLDLLPNGDVLVTYVAEDGAGGQDILSSVFGTSGTGLALREVVRDSAPASGTFQVAALPDDDSAPSVFITPFDRVNIGFRSADDGDGPGFGFASGRFRNAHVGDGADDTIIGDGLADEVRAGGGNDTVLGNGGDDVIFGEGGDDTLLGGDGDDSVEGGAGADTMIGGAGNDSLGYNSSNAGVEINLTSGVGSGGHAEGDVFVQFENVVGSNFADRLTGNSAINQLFGGNGADTLVAVGNGDFLFGEGDGDTYVLANFSATIFEFGTSGVDTVTSTITRSIAALGTIENLTLLGNAAINGTGNALANVITGNARNNILDGGAKGFDNKVDTLRGGAGNDTYVLGDEFDKVEDSSGIDTITSTITRSLGHALYTEIENLTLIGNATINGTGNGLANTILGNARNNVLDSGSGNDILIGNAGNDTLIGGLGLDTMTGGANNDVFVFRSSKESGVGKKADVIRDFDDSGNDRIDLSAFKGKFTYVDEADFTGAMQVRVVAASGGDVMVEVNVSGSLAADFAIRLDNTKLSAMGADDFIL